MPSTPRRRAMTGGSMIPSSRMDATICVYFLVDLSAGRTARRGKMSAMSTRTVLASNAILHSLLWALCGHDERCSLPANAVGEIARQGVEMLGA